MHISSHYAPQAAAVETSDSSASQKNPNLDAAGLLCLLASLAQTADTTSTSQQALWAWAEARLVKLDQAGKLSGPIQQILATIPGGIAALAPGGAMNGFTSGATGTCAAFLNWFSPQASSTTGTSSPFANLMSWFQTAPIDPKTTSSNGWAALGFIANFAGSNSTFSGQTVNETDPDCLLDTLLGTGGSATGPIGLTLLSMMNDYFAHLTAKNPQLKGAYETYLQGVSTQLNANPYPSGDFFSAAYAEQLTYDTMPDGLPKASGSKKELDGMKEQLYLSLDDSGLVQNGAFNLPSFFNPTS